MPERVDLSSRVRPRLPQQLRGRKPAARSDDDGDDELEGVRRREGGLGEVEGRDEAAKVELRVVVVEDLRDDVGAPVVARAAVPGDEHAAAREEGRAADGSREGVKHGPERSRWGDGARGARVTHRGVVEAAPHGDEEARRLCLGERGEAIRTTAAACRCKGFPEGLHERPRAWSDTRVGVG